MGRLLGPPLQVLVGNMDTTTNTIATGAIWQLGSSIKGIIKDIKDRYGSKYYYYEKKNDLKFIHYLYRHNIQILLC